MHVSFLIRGDFARKLEVETRQDSHLCQLSGQLYSPDFQRVERDHRLHRNRILENKVTDPSLR